MLGKWRTELEPFSKSILLLSSHSIRVTFKSVWQVRVVVVPSTRMELPEISKTIMSENNGARLHHITRQSKRKVHFCCLNDIHFHVCKYYTHQPLIKSIRTKQ